MGVDTKGCIATPVKDVLMVCAIVERALNRLIKTARLVAFPDRHSFGMYRDDVKEKFREVDMDITSGATFVRFNFVLDGEARHVSFFFDCDCDHLDIAPKTMSFSMGCWGNSELIGKTILHALSLFGPVYLDRNDCDSEDMVPLDAARITLLEALSIGYVTAYTVESIAEKFARDELGLDMTFREFCGVTRAVYTKLTAIEECQERWAAMEALASSMYPQPTGGMKALPGTVAALLEN